MAEALDSLPYYDRDLETNPDLRKRLDQEIAAELARNGSTSDLSNVPPLPDLFTSAPLLAAALARIENGDRSTEGGIDTVRFSLPPSDTDDEAGWRRAFDNACAQLEHQRARIGTLEIMSRFGANAWRIDNFLLEKDVERTKRELNEVKAQTEDVNRRRKAAQLEAGERLTELETRWTGLVSGNLQLEIANLALEHELKALAAQQTTLQARIDALNA